MLRHIEGQFIAINLRDLPFKIVYATEVAFSLQIDRYKVSPMYLFTAGSKHTWSIVLPQIIDT